MKKLFILTFLILTTLTAAQAQVMTAISIKELISDIEKTDFTYQERARVFGFDTTESCMYVGQNLVILRNYCYPVKQYPAKGFTIISPKYGMIDLYEETLPSVVKHDFLITEFPEILLPYLRTPFPSMSIKEISEVMQKLYYQYNIGCWSSNYSFSTEAPKAGCTRRENEVINFENWVKETQAITADSATWNAIIEMLETKLN